MPYVHEPRTDTDSGSAQRFGLDDIVYHRLAFVEQVLHRVDHREVGVAEQTELVLDQIVVLRIEAGNIECTGNGTELIQLFVT